jgi:hypothetical protein
METWLNGYGLNKRKERGDMISARLALVFLTLMAVHQSKAAVPGFQGTVNNYGVGMNPEEGCRHPPNGKPACSQWFRFKFQADNDGTAHAPFTITNDSLQGYCGAVKFVVKDRPNGVVLGTFVSPRYCIKGKGKDTDFHERRADVDWTFKTDPAVGQKGGDLYGVGVDYESTGINFDFVGDILKVAEAIITALK